MYNPFRTGVSRWMIEQWLACRQRAKYRIDGWQTIPFDSEALIYGNLINEMTGRAYTDMRLGKINSVEGAVNVGLEALAIEEQNQRNQLVGKEDKLIKCATMAEAVWPMYCQHNASDFLGGKDWIGVETKFHEFFGDIPINGRVDGLFNIGEQRNILETKTTGKMENYFNDKLDFDFQCMFYVVGMELKTKKPIHAVLYNVIRRPQLIMKKTEEPNAYLKRVADDTRKRADFYFRRFPLVFLPDRMEQFRHELYLALVEFKKWWIAGGEPTWKNPEACIGKGTCPFLQACSDMSMIGYVKRDRK